MTNYLLAKLLHFPNYYPVMKAKETMQGIWDNDVPQLRNLRRIPTRYRRMLPLEFMKLYQCAIIGDEEGVLTLAITKSCAISTLRLIGKMTGHPLFPVLVDARRMRSLIRHIERTDHPGYKWLKPSCFPYLHQSHIISILLN